MKTCVLLMIWYNFFLSLNLNADSKTYCTRHSRSICSLFYMGQIRKATFNQQQKYSEGEREREREKERVFFLPRLYQTSISPLSVRTSIIVCPRKSSGSLISFDLTRALISSSSSLPSERTRNRSESCFFKLLTICYSLYFHICIFFFKVTVRYFLGTKILQNS